MRTNFRLVLTTAVVDVCGDLARYPKDGGSIVIKIKFPHLPNLVNITLEERFCSDKPIQSCTGFLDKVVL